MQDIKTKEKKDRSRLALGDRAGRLKGFFGDCLILHLFFFYYYYYYYFQYVCGLHVDVFM